MRRYLVVSLGLATVLLVLFVLAELLHVPLLGERNPDLGHAGPGAAALSLFLLAGDVVLPVPSNALMIADGALFGLVGGALRSLAGNVLGLLFGHALGRRGGPTLEWFVGRVARDRVERAVRDRGALAVLVTRPIPIVAETTVLLAAASDMPLRRLPVSGSLGSLPPAVAYALTGAYLDGFEPGLAVFGAVIVLGLVVWGIETVRLRRRGAVTVMSDSR